MEEPRGIVCIGYKGRAGDMSIIVSKFGGSSLAEAEDFINVRRIIRADERRRYIVVSAPGRRFEDDEKITDALYRAAKNMVYPYAVEERFVNLTHQLGVTYPVKSSMEKFWSIYLKTKNTEYLVSRGEYLCAELLAAYLEFPMVDAARVIRLRANGQADHDACYVRIRKALSSRPYAVIPGFFGRCHQRITVFSRGGSDVTGALVARALHASLYENWTDVSGLFSADPRRVKGAIALPVMDYADVRQLAHYGATVLHEDAISPVFEAGIPLHIRNTKIPEDPGTLIMNTTAVAYPAIAGKAGGRKDFVPTEELWAWLPEQKGIQIEQLFSREDGVLLLHFDKNEQGENLALLTVTGIHSDQKVAQLANVKETLAKEKIPLLSMNAGEAGEPMIFGVPSASWKTALGILHEIFIEEKEQHR